MQKVSKIFQASSLVLEGLTVMRSLPIFQYRNLDNFLLVDEMGPQEIVNHTGNLIIEYPVAGIQVFYYILDGFFNYTDSLQNNILLKPNDMLHICSGKGIKIKLSINERMQQDSQLHIIRLWTNIPEKKKKTAPEVNYFTQNELPSWTINRGLSLSLLAGEYESHKSVPLLFPGMILLGNLSLNGLAQLPIPQQYSETLLYAYTGAGVLDHADIDLHKRTTALLKGHEELLIRNIEDAHRPFQFILIAGAPLKEPVFKYASIVQNSEKELRKKLKELNI